MRDVCVPIQAHDSSFLFGSVGRGRGDAVYALVRSTWMPSALTEGLFMMIPEQEVLLASGVARGIEAFLRQMAR